MLVIKQATVPVVYKAAGSTRATSVELPSTMAKGENRYCHVVRRACPDCSYSYSLSWVKSKGVVWYT